MTLACEEMRGEKKKVKRLVTELATHFLIHCYLGNSFVSFTSTAFTGSSAVRKCWPQVSTSGQFNWLWGYAVKESDLK